MRRATSVAKHSNSSSAKQAQRSSSKHASEVDSTSVQTLCEIVQVGKRRNGSPRFWCIRHQTDATEKYGHPAKRCRNAKNRPIDPKEILTLNLDEYGGGIALWGAAPPIYDTTLLPLERGIHVHARPMVGANKEIDNSYPAVRIIGGTAPTGDLC
jgi:hypothetical protein